MAAVVLGVLLSLTGCGSEEDPAHEVRTGQIEEVPSEAVAGDRQVEIGLPTGVLKVKLNAGQDEAPTPSGDLAPGDGLPWSDWHGHSKPIGALKGETFSWAVVPLPADLPSGRDKGRIVGATDPSAFQVTYDGLTQSVDLDTGRSTVEWVTG